MNHTVDYVGDVKLRVAKDGAWQEIGVYYNGAMVGVVTRPCSRAKWFVHYSVPFSDKLKPRTAHKTRDAAIAALLSTVKREG